MVLDRGRKGQFFMTSAIAVILILYGMSDFIKIQSFDARSMQTNDLPRVVVELERNLDATLLSSSAENVEDNLNELIALEKKSLNTRGHSIDIRYNVTSDTKTAQISILYSGLRYEKLFVLNNTIFPIPDIIAPDVILSLITSEPTLNSVRLNWTAPGDDGLIGVATEYDIRYSTALITAFNWISATPAPGVYPTPSASGESETFVVIGLDVDTTYYFAIKTADEVPNWAGVSNSPSGKTSDETPPADIIDLGIKAVDQNDITLNWTAPGDNGNVGIADQYDIRYSTALITEANWALATPAPGPYPAPSTSGTMESFIVSGLNTDTTYYFAIKTADEVPNWAGVSNSISGITTDETAPADITDLVTSDFEQNSIRLNWTAPGDNGNVGIADQYDIRYSTALITEANWALATPAPGPYPAPSTSGTMESFIVSGLNTDTTYYFAIKTADEVPNWAGVSNSPSGTTIDETAPADITDLAASNPTMTSITLTWTAPGDNGNSGTATTYDLRNYTVPITEANWALATQLTGEPVPSVAGSGETFIVTGLSQSTTYYFAIKTADEIPNWAGISNSPSGTTISTPSQPINLRAMGTDTQITLAWNAPASDGGGPITGYNIYRGTVSDGEVFLINIGNVLLYADLGLGNGDTYYYKVAAVNTAGEGPLSNEASATPDATWITGLCGLYVYGADSGTLMWKTSDTACVGPQCIGGSLVTDNGVDFSEYPARNDCKSKGGWLPTIAELGCIYNNNDMLGLPSGNNYWSSEEQNNPFARSVQFSSGATQTYKKTNSVPHTYCVK